MPTNKGRRDVAHGCECRSSEAGKRLLERGSLSIEEYGLAVKAACRAARIPAFTPGQFRHSVATWAINMINKGADPASVAAFLNHQSPRAPPCDSTSRTLLPRRSRPWSSQEPS